MGFTPVSCPTPASGTPQIGTIEPQAAHSPVRGSIPRSLFVMWDHKSLLDKARLYYRRASAAQDEATLAHWVVLGFELLVRARLSHMNPSLLADRGTLSALSAAGHPLSPEELKKVRSISMSEALKRCTAISLGMTDHDREFADKVSRWRNEEVHTGKNSLSDLSSSAWKPRLFHLTKIIAEEQGSSLEDLFGTEGAPAANTHVSAHVSAVRNETNRYIGEARGRWLKLDDDERALRREAAQEVTTIDHIFGARDVTCPACGEHAWVTSEPVRRSNPIVDGERIRQTATLLPVRLDCHHCGLFLPTNEHLVDAKLGDEWEDKYEVHPLDIFPISVSDILEAEGVEPDDQD